MQKRPDGSLISYFSNRVKKDGGINLAQGTPGFPPPIELLDILESISRDKTVHQYPPGNGNFKLLEQIRQRFASSAPVTPDNLLVVQGATEGIFLAFFYLSTILERPFSVLAFDPVYESYPQLAKMLNVPFIYREFESDLSIDFQTLETTIERQNVKVVFVTSPGNPLGKTWSREEMTRLVEMSRKQGFYILFDAVYKDIYFHREPFNPLSFNYENLFYVDSFSKMLSITGWRIGYLAASEGHMKKIRDMHDYTGLCASSVLQEAIARYLEQYAQGAVYVERVRRKCKEAYSQMKDELISLGFNVAETGGGYFLWAGLPGNVTYPDAFEFALALYESQRVGMVPGENFSNTKSRFLRLNIGTELSVIRDAVERLKTFLAG